MGDVSPWVWDAQNDARQTEQWRAFAEWVAWLEEAHAPWVVLPPCWALHEGLCTEIRVFWYWYRTAMRTSANPIDAIRWNQELRRSAQAWSALADCAHEPLIQQQKAIKQQRIAHRAGFIKLAMSGPENAAP